jgi:hypothetical protein
VHPIEHRLIGRPCITDSIWREYGWRGISHETKTFSLTMNGRLRHAETLKRFPNVTPKSFASRRCHI